MILKSRSGRPLDLKDALGETIGEKMSSAWRNYMASLAQQSNRPGILARAMVEKDITVHEIRRRGSRLFVESFEKRPGDQTVKIWSRPGALLTLTAREAVECGVADDLAITRNDILGIMDAKDAVFYENSSISDAKETYDKLIGRLDKIMKSLDKQYKQIALASHSGITRHRALKLVQGMTKDVKYLINMKRRYPDIPYDEEDLQEALTSYEALYEDIKAMR
jgi:hypothetical protein